MSNYQKPNLFIIGAPKCGTTSLAHWLNQHPDVFMCEPKEPHYFNTDSRHRHTTSLDTYESFFESSDQTCKIRGEASVWYLTSDVAVSNILAYQPDAKFIICIRNPIDAALSLHNQKKYSGDERIDDFQEAWRAQEIRKENAGYRISSVSREHAHMRYGSNCKFGSLLSKVEKQAGPDKISVVVFEDLVQTPIQVLRQLEKFLMLVPYGAYDFVKLNATKKRRFPSLARFARLTTNIKIYLGIEKEFSIMRKLNHWNHIGVDRNEVSPEMRLRLVEYFKNEVELLEKRLDRDLSHWLK